jgi:glycosyltransferase involved in cell wall biosynthesis
VQSVRSQGFPPDRFEIIVVDNASTDDTRAVVEGLQRSGGHPVRYEFEPEPNLCIARNRGAALAQNDIVAFIDDDALVEPGWLDSLEKAYTSQGSSVVAVGGAVELLWEGEQPRWLSPELEPYLSSTPHLGDKARFLGPQMTPVGTNFSIRRETLLELGGFTPVFGRSGRGLYTNDETDLCHRVWRTGGEIYYTAAARVLHRVVAERTTRRWFLRRAYWQGASDVLLEQASSPQPARVLLRSALATVPQIACDLFRSVGLACRRKNARAFLQVFNLFGRLGRIREQLRSAVSVR